MYGCQLRKYMNFVFVNITLLSLCLKSHYTYAAITTNRNLAFAKAQAMKKSGGNPRLSSYFQRDLYGPNTYAFGFEVNDNRTGNVQFRDERRYVNGSVEGSYGYVRPDGRVIVTHFLSDNERGFLQDTRTFEVGERQQWQAHWPTKRPDIHMQRPHDMPKGEVIYDKDLHLNVTNTKIAADQVDVMKNLFGIDLSANNNTNTQLEMENISVKDIINGKVPLKTLPGKTETHIGFGMVNDFLPPNFPIVPFELPPMLSESVVVDGEKNSENKTNRNKKENISEKNLNNDLFTKNTVNDASGLNKMEKSVKNVIVESNKNNFAKEPLPLIEIPRNTATNNDAFWYQRLIDGTRNDFLNTLPNIN